jgi:hypothetical protein
MPYEGDEHKESMTVDDVQQCQAFSDQPMSLPLCSTELYNDELTDTRLLAALTTG